MWINGLPAALSQRPEFIYCVKPDFFITFYTVITSLLFIFNDFLNFFTDSLVRFRAKNYYKRSCFGLKPNRKVELWVKGSD